MKCNCKKELEGMMLGSLNEPFIDCDLFNGKTYSIVFHTEIVRGKEKRKEKKLFHTHCPWCGVTYD